MKQEDHERSSLERFGARWTQLHVWPKNFEWKGFWKYSSAHRRLLHHRLGVELAVQKFGEGARGPVERHIFEDMGFIPKNWIEQEPFCLLVSGFLTPMLEEEQDKDLKELFGEKIFEEIEASRVVGSIDTGLRR